MSKKQQQYDIPVTISLLAESEKDAEFKVLLYLKNASIITGNPDIIDWELTEFVPSDLSKTCGC